MKFNDQLLPVNCVLEFTEKIPERQQRLLGFSSGLFLNWLRHDDNEETVKISNLNYILDTAFCAPDMLKVADKRQENFLTINIMGLI